MGQQATNFAVQFYAVLIALIVMISASGFGVANANTEDEEPASYTQVDIIASKTQVQGEETIRLGLVQDIHPKWHTYWKNPGDSGIATSITWELPSGFEVSDLAWPTPDKIPYGPLTNYGYENRVVLLQDLSIPSLSSNDPITLNGRVDLLVCYDICIPESHDVSLTLNGDDFPSFEEIKQAEEKLPKKLEGDFYFFENNDALVISLDKSSINLENNFENNFFIAPEDWGAVLNNESARFTATDDLITISQKRGDRDWLDIPDQLTFVLVDVDNQTSYQLTAQKQAWASDKVDISVEDDQSVSMTIIKAFIFALLGGMILNLMPCVFPVLSMKAFSLIKLGTAQEKEARVQGLIYTAGILVSFAVIAGVLLALQATGSQIGWGFHLQNPLVISLLAYLVFIIGLNLTGLFDLANPFSGTGQSLTQQDGHQGAFFTGVLATLVATPCTAPYMGVALGFALTQPPYIAVIIFLALGFGLALPYLALCFSPTLRTKMPKPGSWMETFKQFLAFPMFLTVIYLTWVLSQQAGTAAVFNVLLGLLMITFMIWIVGVMPKTGILNLISKIILVLLSIGLLVGLLVFSHHREEAYPMPMTDMAGEIIEAEFSSTKLASLLEGDKAILTNMTAAWCITCKVNERIALKSQSVEQLIAKNDIQYLKGDWTNKNPDITKYLQSFDRSGVPLYVFYPPRHQKTGQRPNPIILPQLLTPGLVHRSIVKGLNASLL